MGRKKQKNSTIFDNWRHDPTYKSKNSSGNLETTKKFCAIPHSLLMNPVFLSLSSSCKELYMYMLDYANGNQEFKFPKSIYSKITTNQTFNKNIKILEKNGFVEILSCGKNTRSANIYKFVDTWWKNPPTLPQKNKRTVPKEFKKNYSDDYFYA